MRTQFIGLTLLFLLAPAGCATFPPPTDSLAASMASVQTAERLGAEQVPQAALSLRLAQDEVERTRALMADEKNRRAHLMALRAASDAELAIALVREHHAQMEAQRAEASAAAADAARTNP